MTSGLQLLQIWVYLIHKQRIQLIRRSRKKDGGFTVFLQDQARRSAVIIVQDNAARRNNGLFPVIIGNHLVNVVAEILLDPFTGMLVFH